MLVDDLIGHRLGLLVAFGCMDFRDIYLEHAAHCAQTFGPTPGLLVGIVLYAFHLHTVAYFRPTR